MEKFMKEHFKIIHILEMVICCHKMVHHIVVNLLMINLMGLESINGIMEKYISVNGQMV